jgi:hypothetical protein
MIADLIMDLTMLIEYEHDITPLLQEAYNIAYDDWRQVHNDLLNVL